MPTFSSPMRPMPMPPHASNSTMPTSNTNRATSTRAAHTSSPGIPFPSGSPVARYPKFSRVSFSSPSIRQGADVSGTRRSSVDSEDLTEDVSLSFLTSYFQLANINFIKDDTGSEYEIDRARKREAVYRALGYGDPPIERMRRASATRSFILASSSPARTRRISTLTLPTPVSGATPNIGYSQTGAREQPTAAERGEYWGRYYRVVVEDVGSVEITAPSNLRDAVDAPYTYHSNVADDANIDRAQHNYLPSSFFYPQSRNDERSSQVDELDYLTIQETVSFSYEGQGFNVDSSSFQTPPVSPLLRAASPRTFLGSPPLNPVYVESDSELEESLDEYMYASTAEVDSDEDKPGDLGHIGRFEMLNLNSSLAKATLGDSSSLTELSEDSEEEIIYLEAEDEAHYGADGEGADEGEYIYQHQYRFEDEDENEDRDEYDHESDEDYVDGL
ncbi:hypothetical protein FRC12_005985 [Ceratobasidium sp. 428]|nr:hypothetical protein FRC12_005985 [Ceratobasidium sp. 428]